MQQKPEHEIVAQYFLVIDVILSTKNFVRSKPHWEYLKQVKIPGEDLEPCPYWSEWDEF